ncbi:MAG: transcriptional regulator [Alphaproteobacteria bacterium]|nr:transcriptional regulator [Alphaproteobacteria bacterium]MBL0718238.1 transcriptional regulator [Alphaproteobacteria bacterium]
MVFKSLPGMGSEEIIYPNKLRTIRAKCDMSMTAVAKELGISLSAMSKVENGYRRITEKLLVDLCKLYNCDADDMFIQKGDKEAVEWTKEMKKRTQNNQDLGLQTFGQGLRFIRQSKNITIQDFSKKAKFTISVYHRVETGKRAVFYDEVCRISKTLDFKTPEEFLVEIKNLNKNNKLDKNKQISDERFKAIITPRCIDDIHGGNSVYGAYLSEKTKQNLIPIYGKADNEGVIKIVANRKSMIVSPFWNKNKENLYAVEFNSRTTKRFCPDKSFAIIDNNAELSEGDLALLMPIGAKKVPATKSVEVELVNIDSIKDEVFLASPHNRRSQRIHIKKDDLYRLHKIIVIVLP